MLPVAVGGLLVVVLLAVGFIAITQSQAQSVRGISCDTGEQLAVHYHAHLEILYEGNSVTVPANIGIPQDKSCLYWMHTHDTTGVIHIEGPTSQQNRTFTVGDFFGVWNQPLSKTQVATINVDAQHQVAAYVDGKPYSGDPSTIPLRPHTQVVIEITPPIVDPPPSYTFPAGL